MLHAPVRVLMSEGSSLSARESLTALGRAGFHVEVLDPNPFCLARFSRYCRRLHPAPHFGLEPQAYLERVIELLRGQGFDVLFPAHEQAYLFARFLDRLSPLTRLALPGFAVFEQLQSKIGFARVLAELALPAPPTVCARDAAAVRAAARQLPVYVKLAFGTAMQGVFPVCTPEELTRTLDRIGARLEEGVLVQGAVAGQLERMQGVFDRGRLAGFHANRQVEQGVGGGDLVKESVKWATVERHMAAIGHHLGWHGALSIDYIRDSEGMPRYIDANPRLAETGNALAAGINLPALLVQVSLGQHPQGHDLEAPGRRSFMGIQGLLRAARDGRTRRAVIRTLADLALRRGVFAHGTEELTPIAHDLRAVIPLLALALALLIRPALWQRFSQATVAAYAATPAVVRCVGAQG